MGKSDDTPPADGDKIGTRWKHVGSKPVGQPDHPSNAPGDGVPTVKEIRDRIKGDSA